MVGEGSRDGNARDGAGKGGDRRVERRRSGGPGDSPADILMRLPAVVVLERLPVPTLAIARDGGILFANTAFAEMVGHSQDSLSGLAFPDIFHTVPAELATWVIGGRRPPAAREATTVSKRSSWSDVKARSSASARFRVAVGGDLAGTET